MASQDARPSRPNRRLAAIASQVPPLVREYIELSIEAALADIVRRQEKLDERLTAIQSAQSGWAGNVQGRINRVEESLDDRLSFIPKTRRELRALLTDLVASPDPDADVLAAAKVERLASAKTKGAGKGKETN